MHTLRACIKQCLTLERGARWPGCVEGGLAAGASTAFWWGHVGAYGAGVPPLEGEVDRWPRWLPHPGNSPRDQAPRAGPPFLGLRVRVAPTPALAQCWVRSVRIEASCGDGGCARARYRAWGGHKQGRHDRAWGDGRRAGNGPPAARSDGLRQGRVLRLRLPRLPACVLFWLP